MPKKKVFLISETSRTDHFHTRPQLQVQRYVLKPRFNVSGWNTPYSAHSWPSCSCE